MNDSPLSPPVLVVGGDLSERSPGLRWVLLAPMVVWDVGAGRPRRHRGGRTSVRPGPQFGQG